MPVPKYGSSTQCHDCDNYHGNIIKDGFFNCHNCGVFLNKDKNSAKVIGKRAYQQLNDKLFWREKEALATYRFDHNIELKTATNHISEFNTNPKFPKCRLHTQTFRDIAIAAGWHYVKLHRDIWDNKWMPPRPYTLDQALYRIRLEVGVYPEICKRFNTNDINYVNLDRLVWSGKCINLAEMNRRLRKFGYIIRRNKLDIPRWKLLYWKKGSHAKAVIYCALPDNEKHLVDGCSYQQAVDKIRNELLSCVPVNDHKAIMVLQKENPSYSAIQLIRDKYHCITTYSNFCKKVFDLTGHPYLTRDKKSELKLIKDSGLNVMQYKPPCGVSTTIYIYPNVLPNQQVDSNTIIKNNLNFIANDIGAIDESLYPLHYRELLLLYQWGFILTISQVIERLNKLGVYIQVNTNHDQLKNIMRDNNWIVQSRSNSIKRERVFCMPIKRDNLPYPNGYITDHDAFCLLTDKYKMMHAGLQQVKYHKARKSGNILTIRTLSTEFQKMHKVIFCRDKTHYKRIKNNGWWIERFDYAGHTATSTYVFPLKKDNNPISEFDRLYEQQQAS